MKQLKYAFTLVELGVVVILIAVLATLSIKSFQGSREQVIRQEAATYAEQIRGAILRFEEDEDATPAADLSDLDISFPSQWTCSYVGTGTVGNDFTISVIKNTKPCVSLQMDRSGTVTSVSQGTCS